jgi:hypothetical protein
MLGTNPTEADHGSNSIVPLQVMTDYTANEFFPYEQQSNAAPHRARSDVSPEQRLSSNSPC